MLTRYPYDPTGLSPDNLVKGEVHTLDTDSLNRIIYTRYGGYYNESLVVKQGDKTLVLNKDYLYTFLWQQASADVGRPISRAIHIINENLLGDIQLTYQVVGGKYGETNGDEIDELIKTLPQHTRDVYWDEVLEKPHAYFPARHLHYINDVFGLSRLVAAVEALNQQVSHQSVLKLKTVYDRFLKLKQYVEGLLNEYDEQRKETAKLINKVQSGVDGLVTKEEMENLVTQKVADIQSNLDNALTETKQQVNQMIDTVVGKQDNLTNELTKQQSKINVLESKTNNDKSELLVKINDVSANVARQLSDLSTQFNSDKEALEEKISQAKVEVQKYADTKLVEAKAYTDSKVSEVKTEIGQNLTNEINSVTTNLNNQISGVNTKISETKESVSALESKVDKNKTDDDNRYQKLANQLNDAVTAQAENNTAQGNAISDLSNKLNSLSHAQDNAINGLKEQLKTDTDKLKNDAKQLINDGLQVQQSKIEEVERTLGSKIDGQKTSIDNLDTRLDNVDSTISTLSNNQNNTEAKVNELKTDLDSEKEKTNGIDGRLTTVETTLPSLAYKADIDKGLADLSKEINGVSAKANDNSDKIDKLTEKVNSNNNDITARVTNNEKRITANEQNLQGKVNQSDYDTFKQATETGIEKHDTRIASLENVNNVNADKINQLTDKVNSVKTAHDEELNSLNQRIQANTQALDTKASKSDVDAKNTAQDEEIEKLKTSVAESGNVNKQALDDLNNNLNAKIDEKVSEAKLLSTNQFNSLKQTTDTALANNSQKVDALSANIANEQTVQNDRITALENAGKQLKSNVDELSAKVANNKTELDNLSATTSNLDTKITEGLNGKVDKADFTSFKENTEAGIANVNKRIDGLDIVTPTSLDAKVNEAKTDLQSKIQQVNDDVTVLNNTLSDVSKTSTDTANKLRDIETDLEKSKKDIDARLDSIANANGSNNNSLDNRINELNDKLDANKVAGDNRVAEINNQINAFKNKLDPLEKSVNDLAKTLNDGQTEQNDRLTALETSDANQNAKINQAIDKNADQDAKLKSLQDSQKALEGLLATEVDNRVNGDISNKQIIDELKTKVDGITSSSNTSNEALNVRLNTLESKIPTLIDNVDNLKTKATEAKQDNDNIKSLLEAEKQARIAADSALTETITANKTNTDARLEALESKDTADANVVNDIKTKLDKEIADRASDTATINSQLANQQNSIDSLTTTLTENKSADDVLKSEVTNLNTKIDELTSKQSTDKNELTAEIDKLKEKVSNKAPDNTNTTGKVVLDEAELDRLVKVSMDRRIAEARTTDPTVPLPAAYNIPPTADGEITISGESNSVRSVHHMDDTIKPDEHNRYVYTPTKIITFETSTNWAIPDSYDLTLARVDVITAFKPVKLNDSKYIMYTPSVKSSYVLLKGGTTVPITVGTISSFGKYVTNDGIDKTDLITPSYPINVDINNIDPANDPRKLFDKYGRVIVYL